MQNMEAERNSPLNANVIQDYRFTMREHRDRTKHLTRDEKARGADKTGKNNPLALLVSLVTLMN